MVKIGGKMNAAGGNQDDADRDNLSSRDCVSGMDSSVRPVPAETLVWAGAPPDVSLSGLVPHPHQQTVPAGMVDSLNIRFHCPSQSTPCQLIYPDYLLEPSQCHIFTGPVPDPSSGSHHSTVSLPWFSNEPFLYSMTPTMDQQQFQEGPTELTSHFTQPVVPAVQMDPCEPGPAYLTLNSAHVDDRPAQEKDVKVLETFSQLSECHQTACLLYECRRQTTDMQLPAAQTVETLYESKSRKPCHCTKSQCLKLYCECFAKGAMCRNCNCSNCHNNAEHQMKRDKAIKSCLGRNPDAFRSKIAGGKSGEVKGCNCKRSRCLKNYCECYEANVMCTSSCKCIGCKNYNHGSEKDKSSLMTSAAVEVMCSSLLAQAERAQREYQSPAQAERLVLEEFGHCLSQIVEAVLM